MRDYGGDPRNGFISSAAQKVQKEEPRQEHDAFQEEDQPAVVIFYDQV